eukprot:COSAG05_NODE_4425_length_1522_cov_1.569923_3_plen_70_part_00
METDRRSSEQAQQQQAQGEASLAGHENEREEQALSAVICNPFDLLGSTSTSSSRSSESSDDEDCTFIVA